MRVLLRVLLLIALTGCASRQEKAVRNTMDAIWNDGNIPLIHQSYARSLTHEIKRFVVDIRELCPDIKVEIDDVIIKGPKMVTLWRVSGTHRTLGLPLNLEGVSVRTSQGGLFVDQQMFYDVKDIYDRLGFEVVPPKGLSPFEVLVEREESPLEEAPLAEEMEPSVE